MLRVELRRQESKINSHEKLRLLDRYKRPCQYCQLNTGEDEVHFLITCHLYKDIRQVYLVD